MKLPIKEEEELVTLQRMEGDRWEEDQARWKEVEEARRNR